LEQYLRISIVTPSFNQADYLEQTIESVLGQSYPNLEYIIVDGGSTDRSWEIIEKYKDDLHFSTRESGCSLYEALNKGFRESSGEIMAWINSDDLYHPGSFQLVNDLLKSFPFIHWMHGITNHIDEKGSVVSVFPEKKWSKFDYYLQNFKWIPQESTFWRRELWDLAGAHLNQNVEYAGDLELWLRFFQHEKLYSVPGLLGGFRIRSANQISLEKMDVYTEEALGLIKAEEKNLGRNEQGVLKRIQKLNRRRQLYRKLHIPFLPGKCQTKIDLLKDYPPSIAFDRLSQKYRL
jgi:glycosyltransferase involved in cell wall biosynthesis